MTGTISREDGAPAEDPESANGRTLRILVLSHMYPCSSNAITGIFVHEQVKEMRRAGIDVRVASGTPVWVSMRPLRRLPLNLLNVGRKLRMPGPARQQIYDGVPVIRFAYAVGAFFRASVHAWSYTRAALHAIEKIRKEFPFELIHAHTAFLDGTAAAAAAVRYRVPVILTEHTGPFELQTNTLMKKWTTQVSINRAAKVIAVSTYLRNAIIENVKVRDMARLIVLPNGVDHHLFKPGPKEVPDDGTVRAIWVGHHEPVKQLPLLIEAFGAALSERPNLRLTLIGSGVNIEDTASDVRAHGLEPYVTLMPYLGRQDLAALIRQHDFFVVSSQQETFCVSAIEAMSSGLPVLSTACGGPEDFVTDPRLGIIVGNRSPDLALGLVNMVDRIGYFDRDYILAHVRENFSLEMLRKRLASVYCDVVQQHSPTGGPRQ